MRVNAKGQIIIPKPLRELYGWHKGDEIEFVEKEDCILLRKRIQRKQPVDRHCVT